MKSNRRRTSQKLGIENLESRIVLSAAPIMASDVGLQGPGCSGPASGGCADALSAVALAEGHFHGDGHHHGDVKQDYVQFPEDWLGDFYTPQRLDHSDNPLTVILDFNDPDQPNSDDDIGNTVSTFDVTAYGFSSSEFELVANSVLAKVQEHYHDISWVGIPPGEQLAVEFEIGEIGTPPMNGSSDYYYIQIGSEVGTSGIYGQAAVNSIRDEFGNPGAARGSVIGSVFTDNIRTINVAPADALSAGYLEYTTNAIAGTTSHEIGHGFSLLHLDKARSMTPTGLPPIMGTGVIDLPAQDRIFDRDFSIQGTNTEAGGAIQKHLDQLDSALGTHEASLPYNLSSADLGYAYMFPAETGNFVDDTLVGDYFVNFLGDVDGAFFAPQFDGTHSITIEGSGQIDPVLGLYDADTGAKLTFDESGGIPFDAELHVELNRWQRYIIAGADYKSDATGELTMTVNGPGTQRTTPTSLPVDTDGRATASVTLNPRGDVDALLLTAPPNAVNGLTINVHPDLGLDPVIVLWDTSGNEISRRDIAGAGVEETITIGGVTPGSEYVLTIFSHDYASSGVLSLDVNFSISALPSSLTAASQGYAYMFPAATGDIVNDTTLQNMFIGFGSDVDSVYFAPQQAGTHTIKVKNQFNSVDPIVAVYNADTGALLGMDNDSGPDDDAELTVSLDQWQRYVIAAADVGANGAGNIELTIESTNTTSTSNLAVSGSGQASVSPSISPAEDVDAYRFTAPPQAYGDLTVTLQPGGSLDVAIVLWDTSGNELGRSDVVGSGNLETISIDGVTPGTEYIVTVFSRNYATQGDGDLAIDFEIATPLQLVVDKLVDENDGNTTAGEMSLREAIALANANAGPDVITLQASLSGTLPLTLGQLSITDSLTIAGPGAAVVTIDAGGTSRIFDISDGSNATHQDVEIRGLTLTGGQTTGNQDGAAIRSFEQLTIRDSVLSGNATASSGEGGAIFTANYSSVETRIENSTFSNNSGGNGGVVRSVLGSISIVDSLFDHNQASSEGGAIASFNSSITLTDTAFTDNSAESNGGALHMQFGTLHVAGSNFAGNSGGISGDGGAVWMEQATASIDNSSLTANSTGDDGGAVFSLSSTLAITSSTLDENQSAEGGAIFSSGGSASLRSTTVSHNTAFFGGGIYNAGTMMIVQSTLSGNQADGSGGGIYNNSGVLTLQHATVTNNTADASFSGNGRGGGIHLVFDTPLLDHTIVAGNIDHSGTAPDLDDGFIGGDFDAWYSLIGNNTGATIHNLGGSLIGTGSSPIEPQLGPLANNGGTTQTHALGINSPAIDAGSATFDPSAYNPPLDLDQRGYTRVKDADGDGSALVDMGATELPAVPTLPLVVDRVVDESDGDFATGDLSLREAVEITNQLPGSQTIRFSTSLAGQSIPLTLGEIQITEGMNIIGLGADELTIDAQGLSRIFSVDDGDAGISSTLELEGLTLAGGVSSSNGGAIYALEDLILHNVVMRDNSAASSGGAIYAGGRLTITGSTFRDNSAGFGGAIRAFGESMITAATFTGNSADYGGAIRQNNQPATVRDSVFSNNSTANHGGAIDVAAATFYLINSTISGNSANWGGGAVWAHSGRHHFIAQHSTIVNNASDANDSGFGSGGALLIDNGRSATLEHTIVAENRDNTGLAPDISGIVAASYSLIGNNKGASITDNGGSLLGTARSPLDPVLGTLADNGGATLSHVPLPGSPALDAGDPTAVAGVGDVPEFDQRGVGFERVRGAALDIGATELQVTAPDGDFDGDQDFDGDDIDGLVAVIAAGSSDPAFDLTGDGLVNLDDLNEWLAIAGAANLPAGNPYLFGDANLDGNVDVSDFNRWNSNKFTTVVAWTAGNFNADAFIDVSDYNLWNSSKFQSSDGVGQRPSTPGGQAAAKLVDLVYRDTDAGLPLSRRAFSERRDITDWLFDDVEHQHDQQTPTAQAIAELFA